MNTRPVDIERLLDAIAEHKRQTVYPYDCPVPCASCVHRLECIEMREQPVKDKPVLYRYVCRKCGKPFRRDEHLEPDQRICVWCMSEAMKG